MGQTLHATVMAGKDIKLGCTQTPNAITFALYM